VVRNGEHKVLKVKLVAYKQPAARRSNPLQGSPFRLPNGQNPFEDMPGFKMPQDLNGDDENDGDQSSAPRTGPARLGVSVGNATPEVRTQYNIPANIAGAVVGSVQPGSVGEKLGLQVGDVIVSFNSKPISKATDLTSEMQGVKWGDSRSIRFQRFGNGSQMTQERTITFK